MDARLLIIIFIAIIWAMFRLLTKKPRDIEQRGQNGDDLFSGSQMGLPWETPEEVTERRLIPQKPEMQVENSVFVEDEEEEVQTEEGQIVEREEVKEEPSVSKPASLPTEGGTGIGDSTSMMSDILTRPQRRLRRCPRIAGIPLNSKNAKFGIILSEILNKPKSQRPEIQWRW